MRVKITYGLDIDNVAGHLGFLLRNLGDKLLGDAERLNSLATFLDDELFDPSQIISRINQVRLGLADVDSMLEDYSSIVSGYHSALEQANNPETAPEMSQSELEARVLQGTFEPPPKEEEGED